MLSLIQLLALVRELRQSNPALLETEQLILRVMQKKSINYMCAFTSNELDHKLFASLCLDETDFLSQLRGQDIKRIIAIAVVTANLKLFCIALKFLDTWQIDCDFYDETIWYVTATENNRISILSQLTQMLSDPASSDAIKSNAYGIVILLLSRMNCAQLRLADKKTVYECVVAAIHLALSEGLNYAHKLLCAAKLDDAQCVNLIGARKAFSDDLLIVILNQIRSEAQQQVALGKIKRLKDLRILIALTKKSLVLNEQLEDSLAPVCLLLIQQMMAHQDFNAVVKKLPVQDISDFCHRTKKLCPEFSVRLQARIDAQFTEKKSNKAKSVVTQDAVVTPVTQGVSEAVASTAEATLEDVASEACKAVLTENNSFADSAVGLDTSGTQSSISSATSEDEEVSLATTDLLVMHGFTPSCLSDMSPNKAIYEIVLDKITEALNKIGVPSFVFGSFNYKVHPADLDMLLLVRSEKPDLEKIFSEAALPMEKIGDYEKGVVRLHILRFRYTAPNGSSIEIDFSVYHGNLSTHSKMIDYSITVYYDHTSKCVYVPHADSLLHIQNKVLQLQNNLEALIASNALFLFRAIKLIALEGFSASEAFQQALKRYAETRGDFFAALRVNQFIREFKLLFFCGHGVRHFEVLMQLRLFEYLFPTVRQLAAEQDKTIMHQLIMRILSDQDQKRQDVPCHPLTLFYATHNWPCFNAQSGICTIEPLSRGAASIDPAVCLIRMEEPPADTGPISRYVNGLRDSIFAQSKRQRDVLPNAQLLHPCAPLPPRAPYPMSGFYPPPLMMSPYPMRPHLPPVMMGAVPPPQFVGSMAHLPNAYHFSS